MKKRSILLFFLFGTLYGIFFYKEEFPLPIQREAEQINETVRRTGSPTPSGTFESATKNLNEFYDVVRIVDGDTLVARIDGVEEKIRLIGINTPETVDPRKMVECFGKEASDEAKRILTKKSVRIETDPSQDLYDKYGRMLAYIFLEDGTNFNQLMISNGYGYEYTYHLPYKYQKEFKQAEKYARENKKGLWADGVCGN
ncbi:MAG: thermonuclease family protein [Candidatus Parcubacteria bacterium]|nr:thermonuclease family protein [Candidatus Parcubacteria bacterium]